MSGAAVVLAGGLSARMGRPKALLPLRGRTFVQTILDGLEPLGLGWVGVVTNPRLPFAFAGPRVLVNREPEKGQLSSLRLALQAGAQEHDWLLVALVDQPGVQPGTYRKLVEATALEADLWVPSYAGRRGHPLIFSRKCFADLLEGPDMRWVVGRHREQRREVPVDDPEILEDVDTPADYERLLQRAQQAGGDQAGKGLP